MISLVERIPHQKEVARAREDLPDFKNIGLITRLIVIASSGELTGAVEYVLYYNDHRVFIAEAETLDDAREWVEWLDARLKESGVNPPFAKGTAQRYGGEPTIIDGVEQCDDTKNSELEVFFNACENRELCVRYVGEQACK